MILEAYRAEGVDILSLDGAVVATDAPTLREWVRSLLRQGSRRIVLHLSKATEISPTAWGTLAERKNEAAELMAEIKVSGLNEKLVETFKQLGGHRVFDVYETEKEAIAAFVEVKDSTLAADAAASVE